MAMKNRGGGAIQVGAALLGLAAGLAAAPAAARLEVGAGKEAVALAPDMLPVDNFIVQHDPLFARVVVIDGDGGKAAIAVLDLTSLGGETMTEVRQIVAQSTGVAPANVIVAASHTFSSPHLGGAGAQGRAEGQAERNQRYRAAVLDALTRAAAAAARTRPATMTFGLGRSSVNVNRNVLTTEGWWLGADESGPSDKGVGVLTFAAADDRRPIAAVMNYAVQSAVMNQTGGGAPGHKGITSDLGGRAAAQVEELMGGGAVSLFLTGAAGDQVPAFVAQRTVLDRDGKARIEDIGDAGYLLVDLQGERLGAEAARASAAAPSPKASAMVRVRTEAVSLVSQERPRELAQIRPTHAYTYVAGKPVDAPYTILQIGDVALVGVQVELSSVTGEAIKRQSPFAHTIVATMINGAAKYLPDAESYRRFTYEAMNSSYAPGSAEIMARRIVASLKALRAGRGR